MSYGQNGAFDASQFTHNQPQALGRTHRSSIETDGYLAHRAMLEKNAASNVQRQETRRKNAAAATEPTSNISPVGQPGPQPYLAAATMPHHGVELSQAPLQHSMSPVPYQQSSSPFPPQQGFLQRSPMFPVDSAREPTSTPARIPLQPLQINRQPHYPQYPDPQNPLPRMTLEEFQAKVSSFSKDEVQAMFRLMDQASGSSSPTPLYTFDNNENTQNGSDGTSQYSNSALGGESFGSQFDEDPPSPTVVEPTVIQYPDDANNHTNAQSSLQTDMSDVNVHRKRPRGTGAHQKQSTNTVVDVSGSESDQPPRQRRKKKPQKKRPGRQQPSRSIRDAPADRQPIIKAAYRHIQKAVVIKSGWPIDSPSGIPGAPDDEYGKMVQDAWDDAHKELKIAKEDYVGDPTDREVNLIRSRVATVRSAFKRVAQQLVPANYGFVDPQTLNDATPEKIAETVAANRALVEKIENTYYYLVPLDDSIPGSMYRNAILQSIHNLACFGTHANRRGHYFVGMDKIPLETLALIVAAVRCAIDEWTTGRRVRVDFEFEPYAGTYKTVLNHLRGWVTFAASQTIDVATPTLTTLLRIARETSATADVVDGAQDMSSSFSAASYARNQPVA